MLAFLDPSSSDYLVGYKIVDGKLLLCETPTAMPVMVMAAAAPTDDAPEQRLLVNGLGVVLGIDVSTGGACVKLCDCDPGPVVGSSDFTSGRAGEVAAGFVAGEAVPPPLAG
jgi:hypothetical protein